MARSSDINVLNSGLREDRTNRWILLPSAVLVLLIAWLPPFTDRRELLTFDGDTVRWIGLVLFVIGGLLRIWPVVVLGRRYSMFVTIQEHHDLITDGPYRWVRHPFYLGGIVTTVGWALLFRSLLGLLLVAASLVVIVPRMRAEEALMESQFGDAYAAYRRRSWRLLPPLY
jgi:protein-S-isoprenylcysteine O-methyltransferase Ste14